MSFLFFFLIGLAFGSFASVIIHRLHTNRRGIFLGRSECPECHRVLGARDLIPLLSYCINKFKCRFCKKPILFRYPLLEIVMGLGFGITSLLVGFESFGSLIFYIFIAFTFVTLSFYDLLFQEVADEIALPAIGITLLFMILTKSLSLGSLGLGLLVPVFFFGFLFWVSKGEWLGGGDIRIGALMGALLGRPVILVGLFLGYLLGAIYSLVGMFFKKLNRKSHIPFAPFLLLGTYIALFWGRDIMDWYLNIT